MDSREEKNKEIALDIEQEEVKKARNKLILKIIKISFIIIIILMTIITYTEYCATKGLIVKEVKISSAKLNEAFHGTKIIQFSDLHYGSTVFIDEVKALVKKINEKKPDIVVFTGDLINSDYTLKTKDAEELTKELKSIKATLGKYAVSGENDNEEFITIMKQGNFTILNNDYDLIYNNNNSPILIVGLGDTPDIDSAFRYTTSEGRIENIYTICLLHKPDTIDDVLASYPVDLALAGHSHNGQVTLPYVGAFIRKDGAKKYSNPYYKINDTKLYVSSGIGTSDFNFRLGARPSINFFRLSTK